MSQQTVLLQKVQELDKNVQALKAGFAEPSAQTPQMNPNDWAEGFRNLMPTRADAKLAIAGVGAANAGFFGGIVSGFGGQFGIAADTGAVIAGYLGYKLLSGHEYASAFFGGVFIEGIAAWARTAGLTVDRFFGGGM